MLGLRRACDLIAAAVVAAFPPPEEAGTETADAAARPGGKPGWDWLWLLAQWSECDGDPQAFWRQTPRLLKAFFDGKASAAEMAFRHRAWLAWHVAGLPGSRQMQGTFDAFLRGLGLGAKAATPGRQTPDEQLAFAKAWHAKLGGTIQ